MMNLLDQLNANRTCQICGQSKPGSDFIIGTDKHGNAIYSHICNACRMADDDDEGGGGKQDSLNLDANARQALIDQQEKHQELIDEAKEDYVEKLDQANLDDKDQKAEEAKRLRNSKDPLEYLQHSDKLPSAFLDKTKDWSNAAIQNPNTEFGFDANIHDPLRQTPNAQHHQIFATHPDRMDIKFLLEYILSGDYAQHYTSHIGPSKRGHIYATPAQTAAAQANGGFADRKIFRMIEATFTHPSRSDTVRVRNSKGSLPVASIPATNATAQNFASTQQSQLQQTTQNNIVLHTATNVTVTATRSISTNPATLAVNPQPFIAVATSPSISNQQTTANFKNPSTVNPGSSQAAFMHNSSQVVGCKFVESMPKTSAFQHFKQQAPNSDAKGKSDTVTDFIKKTWGGSRR